MDASRGFRFGHYPTVTLAAARSRADDLRKEVAHGGNPVIARRQERTEADSKTFDHLASRYMAEHAWRHKRPASATADDRNLRKHVLPKWGRRPYADIQRADVIELIEGLITKEKPVLANRVGALISKIFSFAIDAGLITHHPATRLGKRGNENVGTRVLDDDELRLFWTKIIGRPVSRVVGLALRLQLLTAMRPGEAAGLRRSELHQFDKKDAAAIILSSERVKNGREHLIPLSPLARSIISEALALAPEDLEFVFASPKFEGLPVEGHALAVAMRRFADELESAESAAKTWKADAPTAHDLRRTARTRLSALGVPREHCDAIMNHSPQDVGRRHYDRHDFEREKRIGLELWGRALKSILEGNRGDGNIVPLVPRRKRAR